MEEQNPWWKKEEDEAYRNWEKSKIKWVPNVIKTITLRPFSLHFLVGARQVGKTTALKILIHNLLRKVNPKSIFYYSCDELLDYKELGEILDNYLSLKEAWKIKNSIIILDEITFVDEWYRAVKARIDKGKFKNDVLIITGSASLELLKQKEYFPGRRGYGRDIYFYPLSFSEYLEKFWKLKLKKEKFERVESCMKANKIFSKTIEKAFQSYLITGGFPLPIIDFFTKGKIRNMTRKVYLDWLKNDWRKIGKDEKYMKEVITYILNARNAPISWLSIAKNTSILSPHTAESYVHALESLMVVKVLNLIRPDFRVMYRKNKKMHITDPFIYDTFSRFTKVKVDESVKAESLAASHLSRIFDTYYWKNRSEIDIIAVVGKQQIGFEVKWGFKHYAKPKHLKKIFVLDKEALPTFLASIKFE